MTDTSASEALDRAFGLIREIRDYPKPGIGFKDITPLLADPLAFGAVVDSMAEAWRGQVDVVAGIEARGFVLAAPIALALGVGFVPVRKSGKLPHETLGVEYSLEYGTAAIEMHVDAVRPDQRVLVVDDVLATGGTAAATCELVERVGARVAGVSVLLELGFLAGRDRMPGRELSALFRV
ncbi:MAG: adenine phosphoribosyltransferase [Actinomycetales bacterium]|nr:adenine phosphoribosyltransferase [Actinomycetales bacterium]